MKKIRALLFTLILIFNISSVCFSAPYITLNLNYDDANHHYNAEEVYLYINSEKLSNLSMPPIILNNYTLVPAREVFETLGAQVDWNNDTREVKIIYKDTNVVLTINSTQASVNNVTKSMDIPAKLINNKTMIPVRFVSESIGANVVWDNDTRSIYITTTNNTVTGNVANIIDFKLPDSNQTYFKITFDKEIQEFSEVKNTNTQYEIEIYNSNYESDTTYFKTVVDKVKNVSITQKDNTTTFSFSTEEKQDFTTFIGSDKKSIFVAFDKNYLKNIELFSENNTEVLKLVGDYELITNITNDTANNKVIIDLENSYIKNLSEDIKYSNFIKNVKYYQPTESIVRIEIDFVENASNISFTTSCSNNTTFVTFSSSKELDYSTSENRIIINNSNSTININSIQHTDNYLNKEYILTFSSDISNLIETGTYTVNTSLVDNIVVSNNKITINSKKIIAVNITENNNIIYIDIVEPKEKYANIIVLDAGHGGADGGASANNLVEKDVVLDITNRALAIFEQDPNIKVYATRTTDVYPSFDDRTSLGNEVGDVFISVHINSAGTNTSAKGTEVYYLNENTHSSGLTSSVLASTMHSTLLSTLNTYDRKVKTSNFKVLRDSNIPAILCEIAFITNPEDASNLATESFRQKVAEAIYNACKEIFTKYPSR